MCAIDAFCCETEWDQSCVNLAFATCPVLCDAVPPQECAAPGANPVATSPNNSVATGGIACAAGGITVANSYAKVFTQSDLGAAYSFKCVNFGYDNSGPYLEGLITVAIDPTGGVPQVVPGPLDAHGVQVVQQRSDAASDLLHRQGKRSASAAKQRPFLVEAAGGREAFAFSELAQPRPQRPAATRPRWPTPAACWLNTM